MNWTPKQFEAFALLSDPNIQQVALLGGSRSGKTYTIVNKILQRAKEFPGILQIILRKTKADAEDTAWLRSMVPILAGEIAAKRCTVYKKPAYAEFSNGSVIKLGGLHPSEIDKVLGPEYGTIWVNEASEISWQNIPPLRTRLNDRTPHKEHGRPVVPKLICDFNPPTVKHWTHKAFIEKIDPEQGAPFEEPHQWGWLRMNPIDNLPNLSANYLATLKSMSPRDQQRFLYGQFGQLAGLVFDNFDPEKHVYDSVEIGKDWRLFRAIDFGFTNPFVCLWAYYDPANETLYVEDEHYQAGVTTPAHAEIIKQRTAGRRVEATVADHDAGDRKILEDAGIPTEKADKDVASGINQLYDAFNRGKVLINRRCTNLIDEIYSYQWKESSTKDEPVKEKDHALDALRYLYKRFHQKRIVYASPL